MFVKGEVSSWRTNVDFSEVEINLLVELVENVQGRDANT